MQTYNTHEQVSVTVERVQLTATAVQVERADGQRMRSSKNVIYNYI